MVKPSVSQDDVTGEDARDFQKRPAGVSFGYSQKQSTENVYEGCVLNKPKRRCPCFFIIFFFFMYIYFCSLQNTGNGKQNNIVVVCL